MTLPASTAQQIEQIRDQLARRQPQWGEHETRIPVERYFSAEIWQAEIEHLFRPLPLIVAHGTEIAPGHVLATDSYGVPILLARDAQGALRAFLNVCRHRGMRLVESTSAGQPRASVVCPYHGWTYRLDGGLRHMPHAQAFDPCPAGERTWSPCPAPNATGWCGWSRTPAPPWIWMPSSAA